MNRRDFFARLGLGTAAVALSPYLDLAPITEAPSTALMDTPEFVAYIPHTFKMYVQQPAQCVIWENITVNDDGTLSKSA